MKAVRAVTDVLADLVLGDDWRVSLGIVVTLALTGLVAHSGVPAWWIPPLAVLGLLAGTVLAARRR
jgi:hypothetical protein